MTQQRKPFFVGTTIGPEYILSEGVETVLDRMQSLAHIQTVLVYFNTMASFMYKPAYQNGTATVGEERVVWTRSDPACFESTSLKYPDDAQAPFAGRDVIDEIAAVAEPRGMQVYARSLEPYRTNRLVRGLNRFSEIDGNGVPNGHACFNQPDYRDFVLAQYEDVIVNHPQLAGIKYGQERGGPLVAALGGGEPFCFCDGCRALLQERGYDPEKARRGLQAIAALAREARDGAPRPPDGWLASVFRILMRNPDALAQNQLWYDSRERHRKEIYGLAKALRPSLRVGWHIDHHWCWDLFGRASIDFAEMPAYSDWLSLALYFDCAGKRMHGHYTGSMRSLLLGDLPEPMALEAFRHFVGQDPEKEPPLEAMADEAPLSPDHVYRETRRAVQRVDGRCDIYARIGFNLPLYERQDTRPEAVKAVTNAAIDAGADGLWVAREFDEAPEANIAAVGEVLRERGLVS